MAKKGLLCYLVPEALLLCLIEIGKCADRSDQAVQVLMYAAILINTVIAARRFFRPGANRTRASDRYVFFALFATAADVFLTLIATDAVCLPDVILFCLVQMIYALYLRSTPRLLLIQIALCAVCLLVLKKAGILDLANAMGCWISVSFSST